MRRAARKNHERRVASADDRSSEKFGPPVGTRAKLFARRGWVVCSLFIFFFSARAQGQNIVPDTVLSPNSFFIGGSLLSNISFAQIPALDGSALCGTFKQGGNDAFGGFLGTTFPLTGKFSIAPELEYDNLSTALPTNASPTNQMPEILAPDGVSFEQVNRTRTYTATLSMAAIAGMVSFAPIAGLHLSAGPFAGVLLQHSFLETEHIESPANAVYAENNLPDRTIGSGALPNVNSFQFGLALQAGYEFSVEPNVGLSPSVGWMIPFTNISAGSLHLYPASASLELVYHVPEASEPKIPVPASVPAHPQVATPSSPSVPKHEALEVSIKALGVEDNGEQVTEPVLSIERTHVTEVYPMLHYVFFNDGSASIPARYDLSNAQTRGAFNEKTLFKDDALEIHHHVLDIIGHRLREDTSASITLVGARSEHSPGDSASGPGIAMARAKSMQDYLANVWGISRDRMLFQARGLPEAASE